MSGWKILYVLIWLLKFFPVAGRSHKVRDEFKNCSKKTRQFFCFQSDSEGFMSQCGDVPISVVLGVISLDFCSSANSYVWKNALCDLSKDKSQLTTPSIALEDFWARISKSEYKFSNMFLNFLLSFCWDFRYCWNLSDAVTSVASLFFASLNVTNRKKRH